jgi:hypothetical protein
MAEGGAGHAIGVVVSTDGDFITISDRIFEHIITNAQVRKFLQAAQASLSGYKYTCTIASTLGFQCLDLAALDLKSVKILCCLC